MKDIAAINCSVTVMPVINDKIGFLKRRKGDSYPELLVAPGGKIEPTDGMLVEGVPYWSVEAAGVRELREETDIIVLPNKLEYFCSLTLPNGRVVISLYAIIPETTYNYPDTLVWLTREEIKEREDFAPGMKTEALLLFTLLDKWEKDAANRCSSYVDGSMFASALDPDRK
jgi:8-oxo-dGTP pyrophosphatase MutT (NUDIX family)